MISSTTLETWKRLKNGWMIKHKDTLISFQLKILEVHMKKDLFWH